MSNFYSVRQAADKLHLTVKTLQRLDREGKLVPLRTTTGRRMYSDHQINQYLCQNASPEEEMALKAKNAMSALQDFLSCLENHKPK